MPFRTIGLAEDAYIRLQAAKRTGESFSDVVRRLTGASALLDLAGTMPREAADTIRAAIQRGREREDRARRGRVERMLRK